MNKTIQDPSEILTTYYNGILVWDLLGMINSAKILKKMQEIDWKQILYMIREWTGQKLTTLTPKKLQQFYDEKLVIIKDYDTYFVIDCVAKIRTRNDEIEALINWKYFPPSDESRQKNWHPIGQVDDTALDTFLQDENNMKQFKYALSQLPIIYQQKLRYLIEPLPNATLRKTMIVPQKSEKLDNEIEKRLAAIEARMTLAEQNIKKFAKGIDLVVNKLANKNKKLTIENNENLDVSQFLRKLE